MKDNDEHGSSNQQLSSSNSALNHNGTSKKSSKSKKKLAQMDRRHAVSSLDISNMVVGTSKSFNIPSNLKKKSSTYLNDIEENGSSGKNDSSDNTYDDKNDDTLNLPSIQINDSIENFQDVDDYYGSNETVFKPKTFTPRTPVSMGKNSLRQDDPFLRDLTACLQAKQQQKKLLNETTNVNSCTASSSNNYENYNAFETESSESYNSNKLNDNYKNDENNKSNNLNYLNYQNLNYKPALFKL